MQDRLHPRVLLNLDAKALPAHARRSLRRIVNVDGVHAQSRHQRRALDLPRAVDAPRWHELHHGDELPLRDERAQARALPKRRRGRLQAHGRRRAFPFHVSLLIHRPNGLPHGADVIRRGAAAAAHNLRPCRDGLARKAGHVFRRAQVDVPPLHGARHAGVGHGRQRQCRRRAHGFNRRQNRCRTGGAVHSNRVCAPLRQQRRRLRRRGAVQALTLVVHRDHHQHGQFRSHCLRRFQRFARLIQRRHGLDDQQVHAAFLQSANLLGKRCARLIQAGLAQRLQPDTQRSNRAGNPCFARLFLLQAVRGLPRQLYAGRVDLLHLRAQPVPRQAKAVGAERIRLKISAPACRYSSWTERTRLGSERLSSSKQRLMVKPRAFSSVPMAPSASMRRSAKISAIRVILLSCYRIASHVVSRSYRIPAAFRAAR